MSSNMDNTFGPVLPGKFDFTLLFERSMLGMVPAGIVILVLPFYFKNMASAPNQVRAGRLLWAKLATCIALLAIQLANIVLWHRAGLLRKDFALAASVMSFVASCSVATILYIAHTYSLSLSSFLSIYLFFTMVFDITMARSYFLRHSIGVLGALQATVAGLKFILMLLEEIPKSQLFRSDKPRPGLAEIVGFWNRSLLIWVNPLLRLGFRRNLDVEDLPDIGDRYDSDKLFEQFRPRWRKVDKTSKLPLLTASFFTLKWSLLAPILPRLCFIGFSASRPFLMQTVIAVAKGSSPSTDIADGLIGATILIFGGLMLTRSIFERQEYQASTCVRGVFIMAICDKVQKLGVDELEKSAAVTLMTTDVTGVQDGLRYLHSTWSSLLELGLGVFVLYTFVGYACFLLFIPSFFSSLGTYFVAKKMFGARRAWNYKIEERVGATSDILAQLKSIKAMGMTGTMSTYLQDKRLDELKTSLIERKCRVMNYFVYGFGASSTPVVVFAGAIFWTRASNPMTVPETFATFAAIFIAFLPLNKLLVSLPYYASGYACMKRVQEFLLLPELRDHRECPESDEVVDEKSEGASSVPDMGNCAVEMKNVSVKAKVGSHILQDITLRISKGSLAMVRGSVGSGKSALLKTLLGELGIDSGTIRVATKRISYASETPWVRNTTIRDNVIGLLPFIESLYNEVIHACALDQDLAELPDGDLSLVGSNGCNLSGGQKQRLGLATSLFARAPIILLDDVLSALDAKTAKLVFDRVCGPEGLLRRRGCTTIMTTNRLELLDEADMVFEFGDEGRVRQNMNHHRVDRTRASFASIRQAPARSDRPEGRSQLELTPFKRTKVDAKFDELDRDRRHGDMKLYRYFFTSTNFWLFVLWITATAISAVMERMPQIYMRLWMNKDPGNDRYFAGFVGVSVAEIFITCGAGAQFLRQILPRTSAELHERLLQSVLESTLAFISNVDSGDLLNRFSQDVGIITQRMPLALMTMVSMGFNVLTDIGIISAGAIYTTPIMVFIFVVLYAIQYYYLRTSRQLRHLDLETTAPMISHIIEMTSGIAHIRAFGWQRSFEREMVLRLNHSQKPCYFLLCVQQWLSLALDFITFVCAISLVSIATRYPEATSESAVGLALLNLISFSATASHFLKSWVILETSLGGLARIKAFCDHTPQEKDAVDAEPLPENWPASGKIDFEHVTAHYVGRHGQDRIALHGTTVSIADGQKVSITGRTGSGKSSMLMSLLHLMKFNRNIRVDNREITTIPRHILRSRITTLTQDGVEFKGTVRMNLFPFGAPAPVDEHMVDTLHRVGLWAHLQRHGGLDGGMADARLSHGQKQLLFLARAILHHEQFATRIVLVDEATSALDRDTDARIQAVMAEAFADCTVLSIAHKCEGGLRYMDRAIQLNAGNLVELQIVRPANETWAANYQR